MAVKNFFSGVEGTQHYQAAVSAGATHVLMSYLYVQKAGVQMLVDRKKKNPEIEVMIDSGAHTLQTSAHLAPYNTWKLVDYENYLKGYVAWLRANKAVYTYAVELDISYPLNIAAGKKGDDDYGNEIVEKWRQTIFTPLQDEGIEIIYVHHDHGGMQGWEDMCMRYPYVGLPGEKSSKSDFNKYLVVAKRYCTKIHGFAATKQLDFSSVPWFSVDSTSWKSGERYGTLMHWDAHKQRIKVYEKQDRYKLREHFTRNGFNADDIIADRNYREVTRYTLFSMVSMENFYKKRFTDRVFYYELRLPPPVMVAKWSDKRVTFRWNRFDPARIFTQHGSLKDPAKMRKYLMAIAAVQNDRMAQIATYPECASFLNAYWPTQMQLVPLDMQAFRKAVSGFVMPKNKIAQPRQFEHDFIPNNNPPKSREFVERKIEDLEWEPSRFAYLKEMAQVNAPLPRQPLLR